jgi:hypothetical protein
MKRLLALSLALSLTACDIVKCSDSSVCTLQNISGPSATPSPSPTVGLPTATPDPCRIDSLQIGFHSGAQLPQLGLGLTEQLDLTPYNSSGEVPKGCNLTREPAWTANANCQILGSGYNPFIRGLKVGTCTVTASLMWENKPVTGSFTVEVK